MATTKNKTHSIIIETKTVPTSSLRIFYKNPRIGNVEEIAKSLHINGQYRPIIVNIGTKTGRKNEILAGNHTYKGACKALKWSTRTKNGKVKSYDKPAWDKIDASFVDVTDDEATKIVLADNRTAELGGMDEGMLAELLKSIDDFGGTAYSELDFNEIIKNVDASLQESSSGRSLEDMMADMPGGDFGTPKKSEREEFLDSEDDDDKEAAVRRGASRSGGDEDDDFVDVQTELQGILTLREDAVFPFVNEWGIPVLRDDMLLDKLPDDLKTWGGHQATPDDGKSWYFYNYSLGGTKGLPYDRTILSFYTHDIKFIGWWETPAYYTSKLMSSGIKVAVVPDFSFYYTDPRVLHLWSVYKAQWLGRFFQEAGIKVIPRLQFDFMDPKSLDIALLGIPRNLPVLATSQQNAEAKDAKRVQGHLREALQELKPKQLLYYAGLPGQRVMQAIEGDFPDTEVRYLLNYAGVRRNTVFGQKDGLGSKKAKTRKKILAKAKAELEARQPDFRTEDDLIDEELAGQDEDG